MGLRVKFNLAMFVVFGLGLGTSGYVSYTILQNNARDEVLRSARVMMEAALAVRAYTVNQVTDKLRVSENEFLPESVPAFAATETLDNVRRTFTDYQYREAALNPTNLRDRAVEWEADIIQAFRGDENRSELVGTRMTPTGMSLYLARPFQIKDPACLVCHSTPDQAPSAMVRRYGPSNGFGWKLHEVVGAQIISVPMQVPIENANRAFVVFMVSLTLAFAALFLILNVMLGALIIRPVTTMAAAAEKISVGTVRVPELPESGSDEVARLGRAFNRMRRSLERAIKMLEA